MSDRVGAQQMEQYYALCDENLERIRRGMPANIASVWPPKEGLFTERAQKAFPSIRAWR
jgi:hypothetical protein